MKSTGIIRKVDHLGRIVLPKELRNTLEWPEGTPLEIYVDGQRVVIAKYEPGCTLCGTVSDIPVYVKGKQFCPSCASEIADQTLRIRKSVSA